MEKRNYQKELDGVIEEIPAGERPRLLLQGCCGPCSSYVLEYLTRYFDITLLFYNPNIRPEAEYDKRLGALRDLLARMPLPNPVRLWEPGWRGSEFMDAVKGLENEPEGLDAPYASGCAWGRRPGSPQKGSTTSSAPRSP